MAYLVANDADNTVESSNLETLPQAILAAARYDGRGAEFARDAEGLMALRTSSRHIGNNPWSATGEERASYGVTSSNEDDEAAIEEVAAAINATEWGGNMKRLRLLQETDYMVEALTVALEAYEDDQDNPTGPGQWLKPEAGKGDTALLCYQWPADMTEANPDWGNCDGPWKQWGGEAIAKMAGLKIINGYSIDGIDHAVIILE